MRRQPGLKLGTGLVADLANGCGMRRQPRRRLGVVRGSEILRAKRCLGGMFRLVIIMVVDVGACVCIAL